MVAVFVEPRLGSAKVIVEEKGQADLEISSVFVTGVTMPVFKRAAFDSVSVIGRRQALTGRKTNFD